MAAEPLIGYRQNVIRDTLEIRFNYMQNVANKIIYATSESWHDMFPVSCQLELPLTSHLWPAAIH